MNTKTVAKILAGVSLAVACVIIYAGYNAVNASELTWAKETPKFDTAFYDMETVCSDLEKNYAKSVFWTTLLELTYRDARFDGNVVKTTNITSAYPYQTGLTTNYFDYAVELKCDWPEGLTK